MDQQVLFSRAGVREVPPVPPAVCRLRRRVAEPRSTAERSEASTASVLRSIVRGRTQGALNVSDPGACSLSTLTHIAKTPLVLRAFWLIDNLLVLRQMTTQRGTCWSVTINNPTDSDTEQVKQAQARSGWKVEGQLERGEGGTPHYQLIVRTPQVRFSALKKAFPRAHIELARNAAALALYVTKEETRVAQLPTSQEKYPSISKYFDLVWDVINEHPHMSEFHRPGKRLAIPGNALNRATAILIQRGYFVEHHATNPMVINSWKLFHDSFLVRKETAGQTDTRLESHVDIPTIEHNHADDNHEEDSNRSSRTRRSSSLPGPVSEEGTSDSSSTSARSDVHRDHGAC